MENIIKPTFLGYPITPWFITLCVSGVLAIIIAILLITGLSRKKKNELKFIKKAGENVSRIPVRDISSSGTLYNVYKTTGSINLTPSQHRDAPEIITDESNDKTEIIPELSTQKPNTNRFCIYCGNQVSTPFCEKCGHKVEY